MTPLSPLLRAVLGETLSHVAYTSTPSGGGSFWILCQGRPLSCGSSVRVSERRRARQAELRLRKSFSRLRRMCRRPSLLLLVVVLPCRATAALGCIAHAPCGNSGPLPSRATCIRAQASSAASAAFAALILLEHL